MSCLGLSIFRTNAVGFLGTTTFKREAYGTFVTYRRTILYNRPGLHIIAYTLYYSLLLYQCIYTHNVYIQSITHSGPAHAHIRIDGFFIRTFFLFLETWQPSPTIVEEKKKIKKGKIKMIQWIR